MSNGFTGILNGRYYQLRLFFWFHGEVKFMFIDQFVRAKVAMTTNVQCLTFTTFILRPMLELALTYLEFMLPNCTEMTSITTRKKSL
jgi:hypothetical protein